MNLKLIPGLSLVLLSYGSIAQDSSSETVESCLTIPATIEAHSVAPLDYRFAVMHECEVRNYHIKVFTMDGMMIFESNDPKEFWNATDAAAGDYMYIISGERGAAASPETINTKGKVTVVR